MPKGYFTQGVVVLLENPVSLDAIAAALGDFEVVGRQDQGTDWEMGGPSLTVAFRPEVNGFVSIDVVERAWPDHMGDTKGEATLFGAWSMGFFGPFTFPGNLERAGQQAWHWQDAAAVVARHSAFVRVRSSYVLGAGPEATVLPSEYDALREATFVLDLTRSVLDVPGVLCYFNSNGELLLSPEDFSGRLRHDASQKLPPLDVLCNLRMLNIDEEWSLMDTVGMEQLDAPDHEACFTDDYDPNEVAGFLRNVSLYRMKSGDVIRDDNTADGPGGAKWRARAFEKPLSDPPRRTLRWIAVDGIEPPAVVGFPASPPLAAKKRRWPFGKR